LHTRSCNQCFREPVVDKQPGGPTGGGANLTPFGRRVVKHYRAIERKARRAAAKHLTALQAARPKRS
jgi:molybdate transport system regulatory protein